MQNYQKWRKETEPGQGNKNYSPLNLIRMNIGLIDVDGHNFPNFAVMWSLRFVSNLAVFLFSFS